MALQVPTFASLWEQILAACVVVVAACVVVVTRGVVVVAGQGLHFFLSLSQQPEQHLSLSLLWSPFRMHCGVVVVGQGLHLPLLSTHRPAQHVSPFLG